MSLRLDHDGPAKRDFVRAFYRRLLGIYPKRFRDLYAAELLQAFDDRRTEQRFRGS